MDEDKHIGTEGKKERKRESKGQEQVKVKRISVSATR
jgi:hypothetical protein